MVLRRLSCCVALAAVLAASPNLADTSQAQSAATHDRFPQWLAAIEAHQPGDPGQIAVNVSTWSGPELEAVVAEAKRHARLVAKTDVARANHILLRGAALHADIGRLIPEESVRRSPAQKTAYVVSDGRSTGLRYISMHWQLGRSLLDSVLPQPATNADVRTWYLQTSADLLRMRQAAAAADHLPRARQLFPAEPGILFGSGVLHELFASTALQAAARSIPDASRTSAAVHPRRAELVKAERFFRELLVHQPDHLEARVRHGRVLNLIGRHEEAIAQLRRAIADGAQKQLLYLAQLFLGQAEEAVGDDEAARAAFRQASRAYPNAQSPRLALSQIARRSGDRSTAQRELQAIAALPDDARAREDPWWDYHDLR